MMYYLIVLSGVVLTYLALSQNLAPANIGLGIGIGIALLALLRPQRRPIKWAQLPSAIYTLVIFGCCLIKDLIAGAIQTTRIVLNPKPPLLPGIIAIRSDCRHEFGVNLIAHAITLTPGELVVEIDANGVLYTHCLDITTAEQQLNRMQRNNRARIQRIFH